MGDRWAVCPYSKTPRQEADLLNSGSISELHLSIRAQNCLESEGINTISQLIDKSEADLMNIRNFGGHTLDEVREKLLSHGLYLRGERPRNVLETRFDALKTITSRLKRDAESVLEEQESAEADDTLLTPKQLAGLFKISVRTLWRWRAKGELPEPIRLGGCIRWRKTDVHKWIKYMPAE
jgi:excisionase family DNA binding protein